jgi:hypothetical protein
VILFDEILSTTAERRILLHDIKSDIEKRCHFTSKRYGWIRIKSENENFKRLGDTNAIIVLCLVSFFYG